MPRTVIVGDIHGCYAELLDLVDEVGLRSDDVLVSVGDVVDRGPAPGEVIRFFRTRPNSVVVMGNHERKHVRGIYSYGQEITRLQLGAEYADAVEWMRTLPYYFENAHVRVVHAAMLSGIPLAEQEPEILSGTTSGERELAALFPDGYWHEHYTDAKPVAVGHHVTGDEPMVRDGRIFGLDTGACHGGRLTALSVPDFTIHSVPAHADHWANVKQQWQLPVLKTKAWREYTWSELTDAVARWSSPPPADAAVTRWLHDLEQWAARVRSLVPELLDAAYRTAGQATTDQLREHPAAAVLFPARHGRLDVPGLAKRCSTPQRTIDLAMALGVPVPEMPGETRAGQ